MVNTGRKFVWAETIFLDMWFNDEQVSDERKSNFRKLLKNGQIEILTGGWVMTEEAPSHYFAMIDQLRVSATWPRFIVCWAKLTLFIIDFSQNQFSFDFEL